MVQGDGTSIWTLTHSRDFAVGFNGLLGLKAAIGQDIHITSDHWLTWNNIYQLVGEAAGAVPDMCIFHRISLPPSIPILEPIC